MADYRYIERLNNWRRVSGDRKSTWLSPTFVFCQYAKANFDRLPETDEERVFRERQELASRDEPAMPADYNDAELLQSVWANMPDFLAYMPVKRFIKIFTFGTMRAYERLLRQNCIDSTFRVAWEEKMLRLFFARVALEEKNRKDFLD